MVHNPDQQNSKLSSRFACTARQIAPEQLFACVCSQIGEVRCITHNALQKVSKTRCRLAQLCQLLAVVCCTEAVVDFDFFFTILTSRGKKITKSRHARGHKRQILMRTNNEVRFLSEEVASECAIWLIANTQTVTNAVKNEVRQRKSIPVV